MALVKHVGRHGEKKVAIVYRQVPGEDHMCLVLYTESIPSRIHDETMKVLESQAGQNAKELADELHKHIMSDGNNCLLTIHKAGYLKKVPTIQVIVTPTTNSSCRLDQLNDILKEMASGETAIKKLEDLENAKGMGIGKTNNDLPPTTPTSVLSDSDIAKSRTIQADKLRADAKGLLNEAKRLDQEALALVPKKVYVKKSKTKATEE